MKNIKLSKFLTKTSLLALTAVMMLQDAITSDDIILSFLPRDKTTNFMSTNSTNPFSYITKEVQQQEISPEQYERLAISQLLKQLPVKGISTGKNGRRLLLGDIILERMKTIPDIFPDQTQKLAVIDISENKAILSWLNYPGAPTTPNVVIHYNLKPKVSYRLKGNNASSISEVLDENDKAIQTSSTLTIPVQYKKR